MPAIITIDGVIRYDSHCKNVSCGRSSCFVGGRMDVNEDNDIARTSQRHCGNAVTGCGSVAVHRENFPKKGKGRFKSDRFCRGSAELRFALQVDYTSPSHRNDRWYANHDYCRTPLIGLKLH